MMLTSSSLGPVRAPDPADSELLRHAAGGDTRALEEIIGRYENRVYGLARAILKNRVWAEDATQETFLSVVQQLGQRCLTQPFDTWVLCIARNTALTIWRKRQVRGEFDLDERWAGDEPAACELDTSPLERVIAQESLERIRQAIDQLPAAQREVLVLKFFHGLELSEMAAVLSATAVNTRVRLCRALEALRRAMKHEA